MAATAQPIRNLPLELLRDVLHKVRNSTTRSNYVDVLTVCKAWNDAGKEFSFQTILLNNGSIGGFIYEIRNNPAKVANTTALSIQLDLSSLGRLAPNVQVHVHDHRLHHATIQARNRRVLDVAHFLIPNIQFFRSLKTFSLAFRWRQDLKYPFFPTTDVRSFSHQVIQCFIDRQVLQNIISNLPSSVVNLEIDTHGLDMGFRNGSNEVAHVCHAIRGVIPQLKRCRLRMRKLCPDFFCDDNGSTVAAPYLETLAINFGLSSPSLGPRLEVCYTPSTNMCTNAKSAAFVMCAPSKFRKYLESQLQQSVGLWTGLNKLTTYFATAALEQSLSYEIITLHHDTNDLLTNRTTVNPAHLVPATNQSGCPSQVLGRSRNNKLVIASPEAFEEHIEGSWRTNTLGARFPASFYEDKGGPGGRHYVKSLQFQKFPDWKAEYFRWLGGQFYHFYPGIEEQVDTIVADAQVMQVMEREL